MAATAVDQRSCAMMTQCHREIRQSHSKKTEITSPEGDLRDVEADFQSLVNEMVQDGSKRTKQSEQAFSQIKSTSFSSTSSAKVSSPLPLRKEAPSRAIVPPKPNIPQFKPSDQVVMAMPAKVIPEPDSETSSEIVIERQMRVKDRIKKLEKQLSQESLESPQPPEVIMPRGRSGSIRTLADQFEQSEEGVSAPRINTPTFKGDVTMETKSVKEIASTFRNQPENVVSQRREEGLEFKNVKEVATAFQEPITPVTIKPPAPFSDDDAPEAVSPIPVLPPAIRKIPSKPPTPTSDAIAQNKPTIQRTLPFKREVESYEHSKREHDTTEMKYSETLSQTSTESTSTSMETIIHQPIQYSAQVKCEVRSRVNTPDASDYQEQQRSQSAMGSTTKLNSTEIHSSSSLKSSSSSAKSSSASGGVKGSSHSTFGAVAPTPLARTSAKPPFSDGIDSAMPKFSLLRSASTGSVGETFQSSMVKVKSEKDIPTFTVKKVKPVTTYGTKVWSPTGGSQDITDGPSKIETSALPSFKDVPPVWTPGRAGSASPSLGRKEYNKIKFEGTTMPRKSQENIFAPKPEESFAWKGKEVEKLQSTFSSSTSLPRVQSPTVTLLQKRREGQIPEPRPNYLQNEESFYKPGDKLYTIKREYESEDEDAGSRKFAVLGPKKFEGVGPTTRDGVPIALKSGVKSEHQGEWYRRMFDSLHKVKDPRFSGYMSEPDGYDSDYGSRYVSLDRRNNKFEVDVSDAGPRNTKRYVHQPGRIENYVPGFSSLSEKELRDNPEADVKLEIKPQGHGEPPSQQRYGSGRRQMSHGLKESGYESDSTLVFKKREDQRRKFLDPKYSSVVYRQVQQGGEIPLSGLQKPAPPKPKESPFKYSNSEVNIHYRTPVRFEQKETLTEEELARRQQEHMKKVYEQERRKKYLAELEDIERRRHTDNFTPLQKSPIPLNRYDDESFGVPIGAKTPEPRQVAKALFNFTAQNKRELSFTKGDIVTIRRPIDRNWFEGELRGSVGIFPGNYVEVAPLDSLKSLGSRKPTEGQARTRFNFQAQTAMEMSLTKGEIVILTRRVDENWYEGRIGNRRGIFPVSYVDVLREPGSDRPISPSRDPFPRPALPAAHLLYNGTSGMSSPYPSMGRSASQNETKPLTQLTVNTQQDPVPYRALYNYKPQNEDELELIEGDIVFVMEKCDDGWFVGTSKRTGLFGTFPGNYVESS